MKTILNILILTSLLLAASSRCFAYMGIEEVSKERAKELGLVIRSNAAGPDPVRVELEFDTKGLFKNFSRVDLEITQGGKLLMSSSLKEDRSKPGRVVVGFAADRANLDKITLRVVTERPGQVVPERTGYDLRVKDFVDLKNLR